MAYARPQRFFPPEWDLPQETLDRCSEREIARLRECLVNLYEYSLDKSIPYLTAYQEIAVSRIKSGDLLSDSETTFFQERFASYLVVSTLEENRMIIDCEAPSKLPRRKGLYFCIRLALGVPEVWYVGRTKSFRDRWEDHHKLEALQVIRDVTVFCLPLDDYSEKDLDYLERAYIYMLRPVFNGSSLPDRYLRVSYY